MKKKFLSIALSSIFIANLSSTVFASEPVNSSNENVILSSDNSNVETNNSASNTVNSNASNTQSEKITNNSNGDGKVYSFIESNSITERIAGVDRVQTSIAISQFQNDKSEKVILADARNFPDALAASGITNGKYPVLLISGNLQQDTVSEIKRLESSEVIILGGLNSISYDVEQQLSGISTVKKITRLAGEDRYDTCKKIFYFSKKESIVFANGLNFPDALAASPITKNSALLLTKKDQLPDSFDSILRAANTSFVNIVGGESSVSSKIVNELTSKYSFASYERLSGIDRFATSVKISEKINSRIVIIASGESFPDALASSSLAQKIGAPILLVSKNKIDSSVQEYFKTRKIDKAIILGGESTISENTKNNIERLIKGEEIIQDSNPQPEDKNSGNNSQSNPNTQESTIKGKNAVSKTNISIYSDKNLSSKIGAVPTKKIVDILEQDQKIGTNQAIIKIKYNNISGWVIAENFESYNQLSFGKVVNHVPYESQLYPIYAPNGCEPTSLLMGLKGKGYTDINLRKFLDNMPKTQSNPAKGYVGSPYNVEQGRFQTIDPEPLAKYGQKYGNVVNIQGASIDEIIKEIQNGNTVVAYETLFWNNAYYKTLPIDGVSTKRIWNNHVVLLTGYDPIKMSFYVADPYNHEKAGGNRQKPFYYWKSRSIVEKCYNYDNRRFAVVIR